MKACDRLELTIEEVAKELEHRARLCDPQSAYADADNLRALAARLRTDFAEVKYHFFPNSGRK